MGRTVVGVWIPFGAAWIVVLCDLGTETRGEKKGRRRSCDLGVNEQVLSLTENGAAYVRLILSVYLFVFQTLSFVSLSPLAPRSPSSALWFPPTPTLPRIPSFHYSLMLRHMWDITQPVRGTGTHQGEPVKAKRGLPGKSATGWLITAR